MSKREKRQKDEGRPRQNIVMWLRLEWLLVVVKEDGKKATAYINWYSNLTSCVNSEDTGFKKKKKKKKDQKQKKKQQQDVPTSTADSFVSLHC